MMFSDIQAKGKCSDQTARTQRLIGGFAGRTNHIFGNFMSWLKDLSHDVASCEGDICLSYMDRLVMDCFSPTFPVKK